MNANSSVSHVNLHIRTCLVRRFEWVRYFDGGTPELRIKSLIFKWSCDSRGGDPRTKKQQGAAIACFLADISLTTRQGALSGTAIGNCFGWHADGTGHTGHDGDHAR